MTSINTSSFPISSYYSSFLNWSKETSGSHILTCAPRNATELLKVVNWAKDNHACVRPLGMQHNWSTLTIADGDNHGDVVLVDMKKHLNQLTIKKTGDNGLATAQTGISMSVLASELEAKKLGFYAMPAPGDLTLGGVLAIGGHGTCLPAQQEKLATGGSWGSLSNSIVELTAVVWDAKSQQYVLKIFKRNEAEIAAFMVHVGRALIYQVTLQVPRNKRLRCRSYMGISAKELFSVSGTSTRTFSHFLDQSGRAEVIWFPFTEEPWLKVWTETPSYRGSSKPVHGPFNYPFSDHVPLPVSDLVKKINNGLPELTPTLGPLMMDLVSIGLATTLSDDLWGWSKDLLLYVRPETLRVTANGYAIITRRSNIQRVLNEFVTQYQQRVADYQARNAYPMNGPIEIRVTGLDSPGDSVVSDAVPAALSAIRPVDDHPEWDVAIWLDILTMPDTPDASKFYREMEAWIIGNYSGDYATVRVEWSKGWGYTDNSAWENERILSETIPASLTTGISDDYNWNFARGVLEKYDPHFLYSSPLTHKLFLSDSNK